MTNDPFWRQPRTRREIADRVLAGLRLDVDHSDPPEVIERKARESRERQARHDALFARHFVTIDGRLISRELAGKLGYVLSEPAFTAGSEPDDGEVGDDYRADGA